MPQPCPEVLGPIGTAKAMLWGPVLLYFFLAYLPETQTRELGARGGGLGEWKKLKPAESGIFQITGSLVVTFENLGAGRHWLICAGSVNKGS